MRLKKLLAIVLAFCCIGSTLISCKNGKKDTTTITVIYRKGGLGLDWLLKLIDAFEEKYPEYSVSYDYASESQYLTGSFGLGAEYDPNDLYMIPATSITPTKLKEYAEPLTDILSHTVDGESKTIGEKFWSDVIEPLKDENGDVNSIPYGGGSLSIVYDTQIINGVDFVVPNTTNELEELTILLKEHNYTPFMNFTGGGYWLQALMNWFVQYNGLDYWKNTYLALTDEEGNSPSKDVLVADDGRYEALKVCEKILTSETIYNGSNDSTFTEAQTLFLNGKAVMMVNGSWLMNEMSTDESKQHYAMMKMPIISSLINQLDSVSNDSELSSLITAIDSYDSVEDVPLSGEGYDVSEADRNRVFEARNCLYSTFFEDAFIIPKYAKAKDGAKKFIEFYCSDEGMEIYTQATKMSTPLDYDKSEIDMSGWSQWQTEQYKIMKNLTPIYATYPNTSILFTQGAVLMFGLQTYSWVNHFTTFYDADKWTASAFWNNVKTEHLNSWTKYLRNVNME